MRGHEALNEEHRFHDDLKKDQEFSEAFDEILFAKQEKVRKIEREKSEFWDNFSESIHKVVRDK
jgi:hypothetical protein